MKVNILIGIFTAGSSYAITENLLENKTMTRRLIDISTGLAIAGSLGYIILRTCK